MGIEKLLTEDEVLSRLKVWMGAGSQKDCAVDLGVSAQFLNDVLNRRRAPGKAMLEKLGLEDVGKRYREVKK